MALTLTVISRQSQSLGGSVTKVFDTEGGSIGRGPRNDWVLPDPDKFLSGTHAAIEVSDGDYYLCDLSTNGTFVNGSAQAIGYGSKVRLNHGDQILMGEYELAVTLTASMPGYAPSGVARGGRPAAFEPEPDLREPFRPEPSWRSPAPPPVQPSAPSAWDAPSAQPQDAWDANPRGGGLSQDPLEVLSGRGHQKRGGLLDEDVPLRDRLAQFQPSGQGALQEVGPLNEAISVPPPAFPQAQGGAGQIPEHWDKTILPQGLGDRVPMGHPGAQPPYPPPSPPLHGRVPPEPHISQPRPGPPPRANIEVAPPHVAGARVPPARPAPGWQRPAPTPPPQAGYAQASDGMVLQQILESAGLDPASAQAATANPELPAILGLVLQLLVQGMMDVLMARSEVKDTFRLQHTRMQPRENNPLKCFPDSRAALVELLARQGAGFLSPIDAVREAVDDTKAHQMAMMAGMQAAFESLMKRFNPERLKDEFEKGSSGGMFKSMNKAKYWDSLVDLYMRQMRNPDDAFKRLFGEPFAEAYEQQLMRLTGPRKRH